LVLDHTQQIKRAGIFFVYDKNGIIDRYIPYLLRDLTENLDYLLVVVNGVLSENGRERLTAITTNIFVRDNIGFDVWAYKEGLEYIGWETLNTYDEIVLLNHTIFGPVYPFSEAFKVMNKRDIDFWGFTRHYGYNNKPNQYKKCKYDYIPVYLLSHFIAIRKSMFSSQDFRLYWDNIPEIESYWDSVCYHEVIFTKDFEDKGYKSDIYVDSDDLASYHQSPYIYYTLELIKKRKSPVFRRKSFFQYYDELLNVSCGQSTWELYNFLKNKTSYDVGIIWENILRSANIYDIKNRMQLNYILPTAVKLPVVESNKKVALFLHLYDLSLLDTCKKYAENMPSYADIIVTTSSEEKKEKIKNAFSSISCHVLEVLVIPNRGRDVSALLIGLKAYTKNYDYICFIHDKQANHLKPLVQGQSFAYKCYENVLSCKDFVENVITTFNENPNLGLLVPPPPNHGAFYYIVGNEWMANYSNTKELADKLGFHVDINPEKPPIAPLGTCFWYRSKALQPLFEYNFDYDDFPPEPLEQRDGTILHAIERLYPFAAQNEGYYTGWLMSDNFAKFEVTNLYEQLRSCYRTLIKNFGRQENRHLLLQGIENQLYEKGKLQERVDALLNYVTTLENAVEDTQATLTVRDERINALLDYVSTLESTVNDKSTIIKKIWKKTLGKLNIKRNNNN
jgi:rhamnosyltransferase